MRIRKAVITAAGPDQRALPLQTLIDRDGREKTVLGILIEQALAAKVEEICVVVWPGDEPRYLQAAGIHAGAVHLVAQSQPLGYAHAIYCARDFVGRDPFLHMVGDHLYVSAGQATAERIAAIAQAEGCSVSGVQPTREHLLRMYGAVTGRRLATQDGLYRIDTVVEKPTPTEAEQRLVVPGLRAGYYLCFFGIHAFTPTVMDLLGAALRGRLRRTRGLHFRAGRTGPPRAIPRRRGFRPALQPGHALRPAHLATGAGPQRQRPRRRAGAAPRIAGGPRTGGGKPAVSRLVAIVTSSDAAVRDRSLDAVCRDLPLEELAAECAALDRFRRSSDNLYERVRALFFLYAIHRFHVPLRERAGAPARIPYAGYTHLLKRRFDEAIDLFLAAERADGPGAVISSALAAAYRGLGFQTLADQVRRSVRSVRGNQWMFRAGHPADYPLRLRPELLRREAGLFPVLRECTPVRMDLSHSGWSDIFFLGMDFPEGARVLNISIDLSVRS